MPRGLDECAASVVENAAAARHRLLRPAFDAMPATADRRDRLDRANSGMTADSRIPLL